MRTVSRRCRILSLVLVVGMVVAACSDGGDGGADGANQDLDGPGDGGGADSETAQPAPGTSGEAGTLIAAGVDLDVDAGMLDAVSDWLVAESGLSDMFLEELFLIEVNGTGDITHLTYAQQHGDVSVRGAEFIVHVRGDDEVVGVTNTLTETLPGDGATEELEESEAVDIAAAAVDGTVTGEPEVVAVWLEDGDELRLGWEVRLTTTDPADSLVVIVDATDGDVLEVTSVRSELGAGVGLPGQSTTCALPDGPSACLYPVVPPDPDDPDGDLVGVELVGLDDPDAGELDGRFAETFPQDADVVRQRDGTWGEDGVDTADNSFEAAMVYATVTRVAGELERLGFDYHHDEPVDFVPVDRTGDADDNAFYLPTRDVMVFGEGSGGINLAEDGMVVAHEYGHAILESQVPFITSPEGNALHEGFADMVALFTTNRYVDDPACLGPWASENFPIDCFRRLDQPRSYPGDVTGEAHDDGLIYGSAVFAAFVAALEADGLSVQNCAGDGAPCAAVSDAVFETMLASLGFMTSDPDLPQAAAAMVDADEIVYGGRLAEVITPAFDEAGLLGAVAPGPGGSTDNIPDAEVSGKAAIRIAHTFRGDLAVDVSVLDSSGEELCTFTVAEPSSDSGDDVSLGLRLGPDQCGDLLPPGPERRWQLSVVDDAAADDGEVLEFAVAAGGTTARARGLPTPIPDDDPAGVTVVLGG